MGGGSADAAAALRLLNRLWGLGWSEARLSEVAAGLGADVPACVASRTVFGSGRGDTLEPWPDALTGAPVLLVNPRVAVPTPPVFAGWDGIDRGGIAPGAALADLRNDLTAPALAIAPAIAECLAALAATPGATIVRMSGSGATCFALFADAAARDSAALTLPAPWWTQTSILL